MSLESQVLESTLLTILYLFGLIIQHTGMNVKTKGKRNLNILKIIHFIPKAKDLGPHLQTRDTQHLDFTYILLRATAEGSWKWEVC